MGEGYRARGTKTPDGESAEEKDLHYLATD